MKTKKNVLATEWIYHFPYINLKRTNSELHALTSTICECVCSFALPLLAHRWHKFCICNANKYTAPNAKRIASNAQSQAKPTIENEVHTKRLQAPQNIPFKAEFYGTCIFRLLRRLKEQKSIASSELIASDIYEKTRKKKKMFMLNLVAALRHAKIEHFYFTWKW